MSFVNERQNGVIYTVDRERNMKMRVHTSAPDAFQQVELHIGESKLLFHIRNGTKYLGKPKFDVEWTLLRAYLSQNFQGKEQEIASHLTEALEAYGHIGIPEKTSSVTVDFSNTRWVGQRVVSWVRKSA